jgi:HEXXH motif-containing protein
VSELLSPESAVLVPRILGRNARAARRTGEELRRFARTAAHRQACQALRAALSSLRGPRRRAFLWGPDLRAWLRAADEAMALARPEGSDEDLFERVARGPYLGRLLPRGRIDRGFRRRAVALGEQMLERAFLRLPPLLMFLTPPASRFGPFPLDLEADAEEARIAGELHVAFPSPYTWKLSRGATAQLDGAEVRLALRRGAPRCRPRETLPGSTIVLARRILAGRRGLRPGPAARGLADRLGAALDLVGEAWEEAWREIQIHTRVVVPLVERGVVSYSLPDRPGTSYLNVEEKSLIDLADDLLHETAHHRLHSLEELTPLERAGADAHYHSPWRRQVRPLHGLFHATYTFTYRAQLFRRLLELPGRLPRARLRREIDRERDMLGQGLRCLRDAEDRGLLTRAGSRLLVEMSDAVGGLGRG